MTPAELVELRYHLHLSQSALARSLGVNRQTIINWEKGTHPISRLAEIAIRSLSR